MTTKMRTILSNEAVNLLCKLFSNYRAGDPTKPTLDELRRELGPAEYANFELDLSHGMRRTSSWQAVAAIIGAAMERKKKAPKISA